MVALVTQNEIIALIGVGLGAFLLTRGAFASTDVRPQTAPPIQTIQAESLGDVSAQESIIDPLIGAQKRFVKFIQSPFGQGVLKLSSTGRVISGGPVGFKDEVTKLGLPFPDTFKGITVQDFL